MSEQKNPIVIVGAANSGKIKIVIAIVFDPNWAVIVVAVPLQKRVLPVILHIASPHHGDNQILHFAANKRNCKS